MFVLGTLECDRKKTDRREVFGANKKKAPKGEKNRGDNVLDSSQKKRTEVSKVEGVTGTWQKGKQA